MRSVRHSRVLETRNMCKQLQCKRRRRTTNEDKSTTTQAAASATLSETETRTICSVPRRRHCCHGATASAGARPPPRGQRPGTGRLGRSLERAGGGYRLGVRLGSEGGRGNLTERQSRLLYKLCYRKTARLTRPAMIKIDANSLSELAATCSRCSFFSGSRRSGHAGE